MPRHHLVREPKPWRLWAPLRQKHRPCPVNSARYVFLDPGARDFYVDWDRAASDVVAVLHSAAGRDRYDRDLSDLIGELSTQSAEFRTRWAAHNVRFHDTGIKGLHHIP